eukprot:683103-Rhodomonas_salina.3
MACSSRGSEPLSEGAMRVDSMTSFLMMTRIRAPRGFSSNIQNPSNHPTCVSNLNTAFEDPRFCLQAALISPSTDQGNDSSFWFHSESSEHSTHRWNPRAQEQTQDIPARPQQVSQCKSARIFTYIKNIPGCEGNEAKRTTWLRLGSAPGLYSSPVRLGEA